MSADEVGRELQTAFVEAGGVQCGYCTPGSSRRWSRCSGNPGPTEDELRTALAGNICRCTGYSQILDAIAATVAGRSDR